MTELRRLDRVTAGRVEVAIIFKEMLCAGDAAAYLAERGVPKGVAERVLADKAIRRVSDEAIAGKCQRDPDIAWPTAPDKRATSARPKRPVALQSMPSGASSAISGRKWTRARWRIAS
jgi:hypothetical protein